VTAQRIQVWLWRAWARRTASSTTRWAIKGELDVLGLTDPSPVVTVLRATPRAAPDDADRLIDHRPASQRPLQPLGPFPCSA
jgi:predicted RNA polymerase sigma factor